MYDNFLYEAQIDEMIPEEYESAQEDYYAPIDFNTIMEEDTT